MMRGRSHPLRRPKKLLCAISVRGLKPLRRDLAFPIGGSRGDRLVAALFERLRPATSLESKVHGTFAFAQASWEKSSNHHAVPFLAQDMTYDDAQAGGSFPIPAGKGGLPSIASKAPKYRGKAARCFDICERWR